METSKLKKFAQFARRSLMEQVSAKLKLVLAENSAARRERAKAVKELEEAIKGRGKEQVIERVAYIWFNRFCALRFMDANRYTRIGVVSPIEGQTQPEILAEAKMGHIEEELADHKTRQHILDLLAGKTPSRDPQSEAYRLLVVAACNHWNKVMPFLFQRIDDYTELLMPDDLLSGNSILAYTREAMTPDACEDVEVIGWLYQFYISEKKDEVFDGLKKNKKITPENIPAATQLFTPHWIVRYLVENSLGRLWLLNRSGSKLVEQMDYYIKPEQAETDFLRISKPEEIKICDPACGSGHMLTYAFDLLYAIYEEEGYEPAEIPEKILTNNLYGIEIDERAGELAAFALTMKARAKQRRFFNKGVKPNICVLENVHFDAGELKGYMDFVGRDLFTSQLSSTLLQFEEANNFGSLIRPDVTDVDNILRILESKNASGQLFLHATHQKMLRALRQADYLSPKYHVVIANPPYMGGSGMNGVLTNWLKNNYPTTKADLFSAFIERLLGIIQKKGFVGIVTPFTWLYISTFKKLRHLVLTQSHIQSFVKPSYTAFFESAIVPLMALILREGKNVSYLGKYYDLGYLGSGDQQSGLFSSKIKGAEYVLRSASQFLSFEGNEMPYNLPTGLVKHIESRTKLGEICSISEGLKTGENDRFIRFWQEVSLDRTGKYGSGEKWIPHAKGGDFRRWYGNLSWVVSWGNSGAEMRATGKAGFQGQTNYGNEGAVWSKISTSYFSVRYQPQGCIFDSACPGLFVKATLTPRQSVAVLCSTPGQVFIKSLNPTMNFQVGNIAAMPLPDKFSWRDSIEKISLAAISLSKTDWDSYETSWDFTDLPLLNPDYHQPTLKATYQKLRAHWREMTLEMQRLEQENNRIFIEAYGLQEELTPDVPLNEITLTCNPHYRYGNDKSEDELEALLLADTMRELVSYAVGCMFGRYALDKPGLILANQGETIEHYLNRVPEPSFPADDDNVIPMLDGDWFTDDITERFYKFLRVAFGEEHYEANLRFVEQALNLKGKRNYSIRDYFLGEFYTDHVKRYKKRPIYWLFSSPKGSFNALIYMHRYRPDTASVVLNDYLREFRTKLTSHKNHVEAVSISASSSQGEKTKALKEIEKVIKMIAELEEYEREVLYPLATEQVEINLDDGVKVNYPRFYPALKKIVGLEAKEG